MNAIDMKVTADTQSTHFDEVDVDEENDGEASKRKIKRRRRLFFRWI